MKQFSIEGYGDIKDKQPLYKYMRSTYEDSLCLAEVMIEGDEVHIACIVDEDTGTLVQELIKYRNK